MIIRNAFIFALSFGLTAQPAIAQMDVDQADSLNFEAFHKDKKEAIKVWKDSSGETNVGARKETIKTYEQTPTAPAASSAGTASATSPVVATTPVAANTTAVPTGEKGQRFEIRERYSLTRSAKTPYSAFYVIEPLYKQAAQLCAKGWKKLSEKSEPVDQDFYLYYEIECL